MSVNRNEVCYKRRAWFSQHTRVSCDNRTVYVEENPHVLISFVRSIVDI